MAVNANRDGDILKLSSFVADFENPILGIAYNLKYEKEKIAFLKYEPGDFLEAGGDPFYLVTNRDQIGKVIFGETLRRDDDFPLDGGRIVDFYFQILDYNVDFYFEFERGVVSTLDVVRQDLEQIDWQDLVINRDDDYELIYGEEGFIKADIFKSNDGYGSLKFTSMALFLGATILGFIYFVIKKHVKNRPKTSVNFK